MDVHRAWGRSEDDGYTFRQNETGFLATSSTSPISTCTVIPVDRLSHEIGKPVRSGRLPHRDKRAETVHRNRSFIFNAVAAFDMFLFAFLVQVGSGGHTNSHCRPRFSVFFVAEGLSRKSVGGKLAPVGKVEQPEKATATAPSHSHGHRWRS